MSKQQAIMHSAEPRAATPRARTVRRQVLREHKPAARWRAWRAPALTSVALSVVALIGVFLLQGVPPAGKLSAARTTYDFGPIPIHGGLVSTRFPLTVEGTVRVVGLDTT